MLRNFSTSNKEKELQKYFAISSHRDQEGLAVAFRSTEAYLPVFPSAEFFPTPSTDWQEEEMSEEYKRWQRYCIPSQDLTHLTFYLLYSNILHLAFSSNSFNLIHFSWSFNISSLCGGSWHPCVRSRPLSPVLSALSVAVSCSHQRVQTYGVKPSSQRNVF